jgi:hypothetical protein
MLILIAFGSFSLQAQTYHHIKEKVFINTGGFIYISTDDTVHLEGNIITIRHTDETIRGMISFNGTADWRSSNDSYVDGYVRSRKPGAFIFPVGQGSYRPAAISAAAATNPTDAAYYNTALYDILALGNGLLAVTDESWIIQGITPAQITLSWTTNLVGKADTIAQLCVAGWDPNNNQWVMIPSAYEPSSSIFNGDASTIAQGTVTTTFEVVPNDYAAYTLGIRGCPNPPTVNSRYETCIVEGTLTFADIPVNYTDIQWYRDAGLTDKLELTDAIEDSTTYWLTQTVNGCESGASYITVYINNKMIVEPPALPDILELCESLKDTMLLKYLPIYNQNLIWYRDLQGTDTVKPAEIILEGTYYVAQIVGECASPTLTPVTLKYVDEITTAPQLTTPHYFCKGAMIQDLDVKVSGLLKLQWYASKEDTEPLSLNHVLEDTTYFAQITTAEDCLNNTFTAVKVDIDGEPPKPIVMEICAGKTFGSLPINGYGIKWYSDEFLNDPELKVTDTMQAGETYYAANTSGVSCAYLAYEISTHSCFTLYGTVFPFVQDTVKDVSPRKWDDSFNELFTVTARLYPVPTVASGTNPIKELKRLPPVHETTAFYYNGDIYVPNTPNDPGSIGAVDNPGKTIDWVPMGYQPPVVSTETYIPVEPAFAPIKPVGIYSFTDVREGDYVLELSAYGFANRYGKITVNSSNIALGHRELIPGDVTGDLVIDQRDIVMVNAMFANYPNQNYRIMFDLDKDGKVDMQDTRFILDLYNAFTSLFYVETWEWMNGY